jgi:hypothetical protein
VAHSSPRRTKSGTHRLLRSIITYRELISAQSILRNAAIPNYLIPMPFQKVTLVSDRCPYRCPQRARFRLGSWVASSERPSRTSSRFLLLVISCMRYLSSIAVDMLKLGIMCDIQAHQYRCTPRHQHYQERFLTLTLQMKCSRNSERIPSGYMR